MNNDYEFEVIIIGGSYAGLSAALALGRSLRKVLIIDSGNPCNASTPYSHNFITHDGQKPKVIAEKAKAQVLNYSTINFYEGLAVNGKKLKDGFTIFTSSGDEFSCRKLIFASGIKDIIPSINGFSDCWGISIIHCPYCHGYEVKNEKTGILSNGNLAFHYAQLISNWSKDLTIFTNGKSTLTTEQNNFISKNGIQIIEKEIDFLKHFSGQLQKIVFKDESVFELKAMYARPEFEQHCKIPQILGCELTEQGLIKVDMFQKTSVTNIFACGDSFSPMRSVANAVATGNFAGALVNSLISEEEFLNI